jgi:hypothetical protein
LIIILKTILFFLLTGLSSQLLAQQSLKFEDWQVQYTSNSIEAFTVGGPNSSFGMYCSGEQCLFYLHDSLLCQPGSKSPVLMSGINSTAAISLQCAQVSGTLFQILEPFNSVLDVLKAGNFVGFAVPLQNGSFGFSRFSLKGAPEAIKKTLQESANNKKPPMPEFVPPKPLPGTQRLKEILI